jgi:hypothetical protein
VTAPAGPRSDQVTVTVPAWIAGLRDSGVRAVCWLLAVSLVGFLIMALGWKGGAAQAFVPLQMPWLMSGGLIGLAVVGTSLASLSIHVGRRDMARHRRAVEDVVRDIAELAERLEQDPARLRRRAAKPRRAAARASRTRRVQAKR